MSAQPFPSTAHADCTWKCICYFCSKLN